MATRYFLFGTLALWERLNCSVTDGKTIAKLSKDENLEDLGRMS